MSLIFHSVLRKLYTEPSIGASYQILVHLATWFQRGRFFRNNRKKNCLWCPFLLTDLDEMSNLYRRHSIDASHQALVHLAKQFQRRIFFRNRPTRSKNCLWWPCLLMNRDDMSNFYRGPSIYSSYQVAFIWPSGFRGEDLKKLTNQKQELRSCLLTDQDEMCNLHRRPSIDASYQVSIHLAKWF